MNRKWVPQPQSNVPAVTPPRRSGIEMSLPREKALQLKFGCDVRCAFSKPLPGLGGASLEVRHRFLVGASDIGIVAVDDPLSNLGPDALVL